MSIPLKILLVEDSASDAAMIIRLLHKAGYDIYNERVENATQMQAALDSQAWDVVIADYSLPQFDAESALLLLQKTGLDIPFIVVSGTIGEATAVEMMRAGAKDYLLKDRLSRLVPAVEREIRDANIRRERQQANQALKQVEARFSTVFHSSPISIAITRLKDNQFVDVNEAWQEITGFTKQEAIGRTPFDFEFWVNPADRSRLLQKLQESVPVQDFEFQLRQKSGDVADLFLSAELIELSGETCMLSMAQNITRRKQVERQLQESQRFSQATLDALAANLCVLDGNGTILAVNRAWHDFSEANPPVPARYCVGANYLEVCDSAQGENSAEAAPFAEGLRSVICGEREQFILEYPCHRPDGMERWFMVRVTRFAREHPLRVVVAHENITERKLAEDAAKQSEAHYRAVSESAHDAIITADKTGLIIGWNRGAEHIFGWEAGEIIGQPINRLIPVDFCELQHSPILRVNDAGEKRVIGKTIELMGIQKNGSQLPIELSLAGWETDQGQYYTAILRDITQRKRVETQIQTQLQHLNALNTIETAIASSLDLDRALSVLLEQVITQLGVDAADILIFNEDTQTLEYSAGRGFRTDVLQKTRLHLGEGFAGRSALERREIHIPDVMKAGGDLANTLQKKAERLVAYYALPLLAKGQLKGVLEIFHHTQYEMENELQTFLKTLANQAAIAIDNLELFKELQLTNLELILAYDTTLEGWSHALDLRDKESEDHSARVTELTLFLAKKIGFSDEELVHIRRGALLHDIGKLGIPDSILLKPGALTEQERASIQKHPLYAYEWLSPIAYLRPALDIPYCHHEKWDGSGYPRGLKGEQIPLAARIFAVVDVWDALTSDRPYRSAWSKKEALKYIQEQSGKHFDPEIVEHFLKVVEV
jgi:PAS domain S-box-containing protein